MPEEGKDDLGSGLLCMRRQVSQMNTQARILRIIIVNRGPSVVAPMHQRGS